MKSVMWVQSEDPGGFDHIFVDGDLLPYVSSSIRNKAIEIILKAQDVKYSRFVSLDKMRAEAGTPNFTVAFCPTMGFLYKSILKEKAVDGRDNTFVLWCKGEERAKYWDLARDNAAQLHFSLRNEEKGIVDRFLKRIQINRALFICGLIVLLIFCLLAYVI